MSELQHVFDFQGSNLRTVILEDEPWFVAGDVCKILEIQNVTQALSRLEDDERSMFNIGRQGNANIINESGLYEMIFASRKPEAKTFKKWLKQEVLPSIRKTGTYSNNNIVPLNDKQSLIAVLKLSTMTAEETEELKQVTTVHSKKLHELEVKVDEQITLSSGEQRRLQKGIAQKVYELESNPVARPRLFRELHREIKDRFGVASYKDVKRNELQAAIRYIENWIPRKVS
ncbi:BRO family protein [Bacillus infantis]|uniref:BRO family protein n=1 Tax=Bacillus infantis TaxID=324767 RepID=UPI003450EE02